MFFCCLLLVGSNGTWWNTWMCVSQTDVVVAVVVVENYLGTSVNNAVITVPAYFNDSQRQVTWPRVSLAALIIIIQYVDTLCQLIDSKNINNQLQLYLSQFTPGVTVNVLSSAYTARTLLREVFRVTLPAVVWYLLHFHVCLRSINTCKHLQRHCFAVAVPRVWNSLLLSLRQISSFRQFRRYLKNHLLGIWEMTARCDAWFSALYYLLAYLLTYLLTVAHR